MTGNRLVSREAPALAVMIATEPSTPTFQPSIRRKLASASRVMNRMMMALAWAPS